MNEPKTSGRLIALRIIAILAFSVLAFQSWRLQIVQGEESREQANSNRFRLVSIPPSRGVIYDRNGELLVRNIPSLTVSIIAGDLPQEKQEAVFQRLSSLLDVPIERERLSAGERPFLPLGYLFLNPEGSGFRAGLRDLVEEGREEDPFTPITIAQNVPRETAFIIEEEHLDLPGVVVQIESLREYVDGPLMAHIVGYVGPIPEETVQEYLARPDYQPNDRVGLTGVELTFEDGLRGRKGLKHIEVDVAGREIRAVGKVLEPQAGYNLILTIDYNLQQAVTEILQEGMKKVGSKTGSAIVMDTRTGEILALVSLPSYDNNLFIAGISQDEYQALLDDPRKPLVNHAINGEYPPGSTFKMVVASAGLQEGIINTRSVINCPGTIWIPNESAPDDPTLNQAFRCWAEAGHGNLNLTQAIAQSCDIFFYIVAGGYRDFPGLGLPLLAYYARLFGLGAPTGLDLPSESEGLVPSADWKRLHYKERWLTGDTYNMAIGQGFILTTPLQMLNVTATVANGGTLLKPQIVREVRNANGDIIRPFRKEIINQIPIAPEALASVREGMRQAVAWGTGWQASLPGITVAGKTGSAEYPGPRDQKGRLPTHAWFTGFAPVNEPEIAIVVFLEGGGEGSTAAAPVAAQILAYYFGIPLE